MNDVKFGFYIANIAIAIATFLMQNRTIFFSVKVVFTTRVIIH